MNRRFPLVPVLIVLAILSANTAFAQCQIGGHKETGESFLPGGGWATLNMSPGTVLPAFTGLHLVISEVAPRGLGGGAVSDSSECIEIYNPTADPVALDNYYLSDDRTYYLVTAGPYALTNNTDFNLRFPPGLHLAPGQNALVCVTKKGFAGSGATPGGAAIFLEMADSNLNPADDMIQVATGSVFPLTGGMLTNPSNTNGEWVVLYCWDGASDLVCDADYASWGANSLGNPKMDKTGVLMDGIDPDLIASAYKPDVAAASQSNLGSGTTLLKPNTYQRIAWERGEPSPGGNGCRVFKTIQFPSTHARLDIGTMLGIQTVVLNGPTTIQVDLTSLGDSDGDGREEMATEMTMMMLTGCSPAMGQVTATLRPASQQPNALTVGSVEELANLLPGEIEFPAESFFDVFLDVMVVGGGGTGTIMHLHNDLPVRMQTVISGWEPLPGETFVSLNPAPLLDELEQPTGLEITTARHTPVPPVEHDFFPLTHAVVDLHGPFGIQTIELFGPSRVDVAMGSPKDNDCDGHEEVASEITEMRLTGMTAPFGPVTLRLRPSGVEPGHRSTGEVEELANVIPDQLDVNPFTPGQLAESFFDVYFEIEVMGQVYHNHLPPHLTTVISNKPPARGETYVSHDVIELFNDADVPTGIFLTRAEHTPNPIEKDVFANTFACITIQGPYPAPIEMTTQWIVALTGPTSIVSYLDQFGDTDGDGREQVPIEMMTLDLHGEDPQAGPVSMKLRSPTDPPFMRSLGEMEEPAAAGTPGYFDVPPFMPSGSVASFFDIFGEVTVGGMTLHNVDPMRMEAVITHKPPAAGEKFVMRNGPIVLYDEAGSPTLYSVVAAYHIPNVVPPLGVESASLPTALAIERVRPNPARDAARIDYMVPKGDAVRLAIYDVNGRMVCTLADGVVEPGAHTAVWNGRTDSGGRAGPGVYFARLSSGSRFVTQRIALVR